MVAELMPCPFCGQDGHLEIVDAGGVEMYEDDVPCGSMRTFQVKCRYCGAAGPEALEYESAAAEGWNDREGCCDEKR